MDLCICPSKKHATQAAILSCALVLSQAVTVMPAFAEGGNISIAGQTAFSLKVGAQTRADQIQQNLDNALVAAKDKSPKAVNVVYVKGQPVITLSGYQVATVTAADAKASGVAPALLAKKWADAIRQNLTNTDNVNAYVAQLSGDYQSSAPQATAPVAAPARGGSKVGYIPYNEGGGNQPQPQPNYNGVAAADDQAPPLNYGHGGGQPRHHQYQGQGGQGMQESAQYAPQEGGNFPPAGYPQGGGGYPMQQGRVAYAPAGLTIPVTLNTSIDTTVAKAGDMVQATINQSVFIGPDNTAIPAGTVVVGTITEAKAGGFMTKSGMLGIKFNRIRTPDGAETPISAHIQGGIGKYTGQGGGDADVVRGEGMGTKFGQVALRSALGAGGGAALGTAVGAIAGGGRGAGRGAWSGTAIGGGLGLADSLLLRKGKDVKIQSGQNIKLQLDAPASISAGGPQPYTGAL